MEPRADRPATPASFEERWRERFREFAEIRDDDAGIAGWSISGLGARLRRFSELWCRREPGFWLDAGCGAGTYVRLLENAGQHVVGIDYSFLSLQKARALNGGRYVVADVRRLPFGSGGFDGVLCFGVVQALADSESALRELARNVRPGGELWVDALNGSCVVNAARMLARRIAGRPMHLRYESPRSIRRILRASGLVDVELHWMPIVPSKWARVQAWLERPAMRRAVAVVPLIGLLLSHAFIVHAKRPDVTVLRTAA